MAKPMRLLRPSDAPKLDEFPASTALEQMREACDAINRDPSAYFHFPWKALDGLVDGVPPGDVWYIGAFSGHGKTTFLTSLVDDLHLAGKRVYYMGLESRPKVLRTHLACKRLGYNAGDLLSGRYRAWSNWEAVRDEVAEMILSMGSGEDATAGWDLLRFSSEPYVDEQVLYEAAAEAKSFNADVFVIDHIDHVRAAEKRSLYEESVAVNRALLDIAQQYGLRILAATQFSNEAVKGRRSALYLPPQPQYVKNGGHKREVASGMLGLYRPLKLSGLSKQQLKAFNEGALEPGVVIEPNVMAVVVMKHRLFGEREGRRVFLRVEKGKVLNAEQDLFENPRAI